VHLDLERAGVIPDPFERAHELGCQWVDEEDWSYKTQFEFRPTPGLERRSLRFQGLDTVCEVFLNGERVARHENMFVPLEIDVSERLRGGSNELRVEFQSAARVGRERRSQFLAREGLPDGIRCFDERAFVRKAQYMFGWDWGPRLVSAGIWAPLELCEYSARFRDIRVSERHLADGDVELRFESALDGSGSVLHFVEGAKTALADGETLRLSKPELWWPIGLGPQRLHAVVSFLVPPGTPADRASAEARALDRRELRLGLRRLELSRKPDQFGESFEFWINGRPLWAVGANWIPDDSFPARVSPQRTRQKLERARDLGMNMLRVWGGGLYESDAFYDACDELGLLVWQDFAYACSYYPDDEEAQAVAREEAESAVRRLRHHASLALWCGNNENHVMHHDRWSGPQGPFPRYHGELLYDRTLPAVLAEHDAGRPYLASSPAGGENPNCGGIGDQHYWDVWHGRGDYVFYADSRARFSSEFGFAAAPGHAAIRRMLGNTEAPLAREMRHPLARWHDKTAKGYETFVGYVELHYPSSSTLEEWSYYSQLNQRDALRFGIEHYRRSEFCKGALIWQFNDCWPVQSWAVLDSEGEYKAAAYDLRRLYAPLLLSIERSGSVARVWVILDNSDRPVRGKLELEARSLANGDVLRSFDTDVELAPGTRRMLLECEIGGLPRETTLLSAALGDTRRFALLAEPKQVRIPLAHLAITPADSGIWLETDAPVVDLLLWDEAGGATFLDNYVTLPGPGRMLLRSEGTPSALCARSLAGRHSL
jgi:beta-mannosidase